LVEQLQEDAQTGDLDPRVASADLEQIERSLRVCRRIFGGMLKFARSATRNESGVHLHHEVECTLAILRDGFEKRRISIEVDLPADLPPVKAVQADVESLLLNLMSNAQHAMQADDRLSIRARRNGDSIQLDIEDTGCGIPAENLSKVQEPFFTTKPSGNGLGLAICRSIVSQMRGRLEIQSTVGKGTLVQVRFRVAKEP
jgi:signal transduction histidine kinase